MMLSSAELNFNYIQFTLVELGSDKREVIRIHRSLLINISPFFGKLFQKRSTRVTKSIVEIQVPNLEIASKLIEWIRDKTPYLPEGTEKLAKVWLFFIPSPKKTQGRFLI